MLGKYINLYVYRGQMLSLEWTSLGNLIFTGTDNTACLLIPLFQQQSRPYSIKAQAATSKNILDKPEQVEHALHHMAGFKLQSTTP